MDNPGVFSLGDITITAANTYTGEWVTDLDGMVDLISQMRLDVGGGSGTVKAYLQTTLDDGQTPIDIACNTFSASGVAVQSFSTGARTSRFTPTDAMLDDDTAIDGILGNRARVKLVTTGTFSNSIFHGRINAS